MVSHGCAQFLKERLVDTSDIYATYVCNACGLIASKKKEKDLWECIACKNAIRTAAPNDIDTMRTSTNVSRVVLPYAFKLLVQELMAINILPRLKVKQDEYTMIN